MAEIGIIEQFKASHGRDLHEHDFKIEVVLEGKIDAETGFTAGIDHYQVISDIKQIISKVENRDLKKILSALGYKSSSIESIASYFLNKIKNKYPVKSVKIWETESRYGTVYSNDAKF